MKDFRKLSKNLQSSIFQYRIDDFNKQIIELINFLSQELEESINTEKQDEIKKIIDNINKAFINKDYLLFADILKYELEINYEVN